jgi:excinuclease UvrABC helicase subunit UvrB
MKEFTLKTNLTEEDFLYMVREYNLSCKYSHKIIKNENMVVEEWSSKYNPLIKLSRFYPFENNLERVPKDERINLLQKMLNESVEVENYEDAAKFRDMIIDIKSK